MLRTSSAQSVSFTEYPIPTSSYTTAGITAGPDGALWFAEDGGNKIGRITTSGVITEYSIPTADSMPYAIAAGPDGALWFTAGGGNKIGRITTSGMITEYPIPTYNAGPNGITAGPDGALWFVEFVGNKIGRITTSGVITEYSIPTADSGPWAIAAGSDGALWFTEERGNKIGRITTAGAITEYPVPSIGSPYGITAGPDGAVWFTEFWGNMIGRITTTGVITEYPLPTSDSWPHGITAGPDGALWFTEFYDSKIGRAAIASAVTITTTSLPNGTIGVPYSATLAAQGGTAPYTWSVSAGALPSGLSLNPATGAITGTPAGTGIFNSTFTATDGSVPQQTASKTFSLTIAPPCTYSLSTTSQTVPSVNNDYSVGVTAPSGCSWSAVANAAWLTITSGGSGSGNGTVVYNVAENTVSTVRTGTLTVAGQTVTITQNATLSISTAAQLQDGMVGVAYTFSMQAVGGNGSYTWSNPGGALPVGLTLSSGGILAGIPSNAGTYSFNIGVSDGLIGKIRQFSLNIALNLTLNCTPATGPTTVGSAYTATCTATGGTAPYSWSISSGTLPAGLTPNPSGSTAMISGTPTASGSYSYTVRVTDSSATPQVATQAYSGTIGTGLTITTTSLPNGTVGAAYSTTLAVQQGTPPYSWSVVSGTPPAGLALSGSGVIGGTPTAAGTAAFTVRVTDSAAAIATQAYSLTIVTGLAIGSLNPSTATAGGVGFTLTVNGSGFVSGAVVQWNGSPLNTNFVGGTQLTATVPPGLISSAGAATVSVSNPGPVVSTSSAFIINPLQLPSVTIEGLSDSVNPTEQPTLRIKFGGAYTTPITGRMTLAFASDAVDGVDSPKNAVFQNGLRTFDFSVPDNTAPLPAVGLQAGTVAGRITVTVSLLQAGSVNITPASTITQSATVSRLPPAITRTCLARTGTGFDAVVIGHSTPREVIRGTFYFTATPGSGLQTTELSPGTIGGGFTTWYQSSASQDIGSAFKLVQSFTVQGDVNAIQSVSVALTNRMGDSARSTAAYDSTCPN